MGCEAHPRRGQLVTYARGEASTPVRRQLLGYIGEELSVASREAVRKHLIECKSCAEIVQRYMEVLEGQDGVGR